MASTGHAMTLTCGWRPSHLDRKILSLSRFIRQWKSLYWEYGYSEIRWFSYMTLDKNSFHEILNIILLSWKYWHICIANILVIIPKFQLWHVNIWVQRWLIGNMLERHADGAGSISAEAPKLQPYSLEGSRKMRSSDKLSRWI